MRPFWHLSRTLEAGTWAMRLAGETYLPQFQKESDKAYEVRKNRSFLLNKYAEAIDTLTGKVFNHPIIIDDGMDPRIEEWLENVDLLGNDITQFSKKYFKDILGGALAHILVDMPTMPEGATRAQEQAANLRPYFKHVRGEQAIAAVPLTRNGEEITQHLRLRIPIKRKSGPYGEETAEQIRVYDDIGGQIVFTLYELDPETDQWNIVQGPMNLRNINLIPLVTTYSDRLEYMISRLTLENLAHLNVRHWQSSSDQVNILAFSRFPMMAATGVTQREGEALVVGPNAMLVSSTPGSKFEVIETTGASIGMGFEDLDRLEKQMSRAGMDPLLQRANNVSATVGALDTKEANCVLGAIALSMERSLNKAIELMGIWMNIPNPGTVSVNLDFGLAMDKTADVDALLKAMAGGWLSHETFLSELKRRDVLDDMVDIETEVEQAMEMQKELGMLMDDRPVAGGSDADTSGRPPAQTAGRRADE